MPHTSCKFTVQEVHLLKNMNSHEQYGDELIKMSAEYDPNKNDDVAFSIYTPVGSLEFRLSNPALKRQFEPGQVYMVHLVPVEDNE